MYHRAINRRKLLAVTGLLALALAAVATPAGRSVAVTTLVDFVEISERAVRFPCWIVDHSRCFSLDRFDPTCPQCI
jgi:hypothetical protein